VNTTFIISVLVFMLVILKCFGIDNKMFY
jgi:hypothetical protein